MRTIALGRAAAGELGGAISVENIEVMNFEVIVHITG